MAKKRTTTTSATKTNGRPKGNFGPTGLGSKTFSKGGKMTTRKRCKC